MSQIIWHPILYLEKSDTLWPHMNALHCSFTECRRSAYHSMQLGMSENVLENVIKKRKEPPANTTVYKWRLPGKWQDVQNAWAGAATTRFPSTIRKKGSLGVHNIGHWPPPFDICPQPSAGASRSCCFTTGQRLRTNMGAAKYVALHSLYRYRGPQRLS